MSNNKYTQKDFYTVIYVFHNSTDKRQTEIVKETGYNLAYVDKSLTRYLDLRLNLGELARDTKTMESFVSICLEDDNNNNK